MSKQLIDASGNNQIVLEQYTDYVTNRQFRQSIFVKQKRQKNINRQVNKEKITNSYFHVCIEKEVTPRQETPNHTYYIFNRRPENFYRTDSKEAIRILDVMLNYSNQVFSYKEFVRAVNKAAGPKINEENVYLLLQFLTIKGLIEPSSEKPALNQSASKIDAKPMLAEMNRTALNTRHYLVNAHLGILNVDNIAFIMAPYFDGQHSKEELVDIMISLVEKDELFFDRKADDGTLIERISDKAEIRKLSTNVIDDLCNLFYNAGMLVEQK